MLHGLVRHISDIAGMYNCANVLNFIFTWVLCYSLDSGGPLDFPTLSTPLLRHLATNGDVNSHCACVRIELEAKLQTYPV